MHVNICFYLCFCGWNMIFEFPGSVSCVMFLLFRTLKSPWQHFDAVKTFQGPSKEKTTGKSNRKQSDTIKKSYMCLKYVCLCMYDNSTHINVFTGFNSASRKIPLTSTRTLCFLHHKYFTITIKNHSHYNVCYSTLGNWNIVWWCWRCNSLCSWNMEQLVTIVTAKRRRESIFILKPLSMYRHLVSTLKGSCIYRMLSSHIIFKFIVLISIQHW